MKTLTDFNKEIVKKIEALGAETKRTEFSDTHIGGRRGYHYEFLFADGYTADVVKTLCVNPMYEFGTYGAESDLWELALMKGQDFVYDTDITCDVEGFQTDDDIYELCERIAALKPA